MLPPELRARLDPDQLAAALHAGSAVVSAGAGSGKTHTLAYRYLSLVLDGASPGELLCLTFTRKAAAEMRARIHGLLASRPEPEARRALDSFSEAAISTLDSFTLGIVREGGARWGYGPDVRLSERERDAIAESTALRLMLEREGDPAMAFLLKGRPWRKSWKEGLAELAKAMSPAAPFDFCALLAAQEARRRDEIEALRRRMADMAGGIIDPAAQGTDAAKAYAAWWREALSADGEEAFRRAIARDYPRKSTGKQALNAAIAEAHDELKASRLLVLLALDSAGLERVHGPLADFLGDFQERFFSALRAARVMGFKDAAIMAIEALKADDSLRERRAGRYRHIMIDEFQDNNALQKRLLYLLSGPCCDGREPRAEDLEPGKLLFVGDEKQSIYRFRGADVAVFRALTGELGGARLALPTNYRSSPSLLRFFNALFPLVFSGASKPYEAEYEALKEPAPREGAPAPQPRPVEIALIDPSAGLSASARERLEAEHVAERILKLHEGEGFAYDEIAVLMRTKKPQGALERAFRARGIPYAAADQVGLFKEALLGDVMAALGVVADSRDRFCLAAFLRSPMAALSDAALGPALEAFPGEIEGLPEADARRYAEAAALIQGARRTIRRGGIAEGVELILRESGYRSAIAAEPALQNYKPHIEHIMALADAADAEGEGLASFIERLEAYRADEEKLDAQESGLEAGRGVSLMTVHKSKGLEFKAVFVVDCGSSIKGDRLEGSPFFIDPDLGPCPSLPPDGSESEHNLFFELRKAELDRMAEAELKRLLYVASTRVEEFLSFSGTGAPGQGSKKEGSFFSLILPRIDALEGMVEVAEVASDGGKKSWPRPHEPPVATEIVEAFSKAPCLVPPAMIARFFPSQLDAEYRPEGRSCRMLRIDEWIGSDPDRSAAFGTLCHEAVQAAAMSASHEPDATLEKTFGPKLCEALEEARAMAAAFMESPLGKRCARAERKEVELPFILRALPSDGFPRVLEGRMDLILIDREGLAVIDFKTDRFVDPRAHAAQMECYARAARAIYRMEPELWLFWLREGRAERVQPGFDLEGALMAAEEAGRGVDGDCHCPGQSRE
jgi:ATP-dependent exoDNAse (exonuclease V) beta subunit